MTTIEDVKLGFIGAGNMASAMIKGLIEKGFSQDRIFASAPHQEHLAELHTNYGIQTSQDNSWVCENADVIILAIKPQVLPEVCQELQVVLHASPPRLLISIAAGCDTVQIAADSGIENSKIPIIRAMPNTPSSIGLGITGLFSNQTLSQELLILVESLFSSIGETVWIPTEDLMDVVTALSGSGPAYFYLVLESLIAGAVACGLPEEIATNLAQQTALGAATLAKNSEESISLLRKRVTSPGGTTEAGIASLLEAKLPEHFANAIKAATLRGQNLRKPQS